MKLSDISSIVDKFNKFLIPDFSQFTVMDNSIQDKTWYEIAKTEQADRHSRYDDFNPDWRKSADSKEVGVRKSIHNFINSMPGFKQLNQLLENLPGTPENYHMKGAEQDSDIAAYEKKHPDYITNDHRPDERTLES